MVFQQTEPGNNCCLVGGKQNKPPDQDGLLIGTAYEIRTRVTGVRGQRPRPLDERGVWVAGKYPYQKCEVAPPGLEPGLF